MRQLELVKEFIKNRFIGLKDLKPWIMVTGFLGVIFEILLMTLGIIFDFLAVAFLFLECLVTTIGTYLYLLSVGKLKESFADMFKSTAYAFTYKAERSFATINEAIEECSSIDDIEKEGVEIVTDYILEE